MISLVSSSRKVVMSHGASVLTRTWLTFAQYDGCDPFGSFVR